MQQGPGAHNVLRRGEKLGEGPIEGYVEQRADTAAPVTGVSPHGGTTR